ncbi:hypothetical protein [Silvanigrella aquatica]|uniref:Uncharacterized protein n=1 Tax=Silvanigrella aquatica TaxID=1915309 RepID=A0A1L4CY04_9BACT|nr:hypothetical protein [Silvanigrella aquatica]APJ02828.1 hypothetical protein AXG55_02385 [Silvanigrella aquatica]
MILFEYHSDEKIGMLKSGMSIDETRNLFKSCYKNCKKSEFKSEYDYFMAIGIMAYYNDLEKLTEIEIVEEKSIFMYKNMNLFSNYLNLKRKLIELKINFTSENEGMELENKKLGLYVPDLLLDPKDPANEKAIVKTVLVDMSKGCSVSFERLISNHIPSKEAYIGSKISSDNGPAIRIVMTIKNILQAMVKVRLQNNIVKCKNN